MSNSSNIKVAVITGGGSGMGEGVAKELASKGWKVAVLDMNEKSGKAIAEQLGGIFIKTDVTNYDNQAAAFQKTWETYKQIDFVYANAGIVDTYPFYSKHDTLPPPKLPLLVQEVCLTGVVYSSYLAMHYMRQNPVKGGSIIMTSSAAGIYESPMVPVYAGAKHGVVGFMRSLAPELAKENIRVNCTLPGAVRTNLCDEETWNGFDSDNFTTVKNIVDNVVRVLEDPSITGKAVEISKGQFYYRDQHEFCDEQQAKTMGAAAAM